MNTNHTHQIRTAAIATVVAFVACAGTASAAFAGETHGDGDGGSGTAAISPYGEPVAALGGISFAKYLEDHEASDPRTATLV